METAHNAEVRLSSLIEKKADRFDPARFAYIEALVRRSAKQRPSVRRSLEEKALEAIERYRLRFETAHKEGGMSRPTGMDAKKTEQHRDMGNRYAFSGNQRMAEGNEKDAGNLSLAELTHQLALSRRLAQQDMANGSLTDLLRQKEEDLIAALDVCQDGKNIQPAISLKGFGALRFFETSRAIHHADTVAALAVKNLPDNPGHLNRQMLITRCLCVMREIAPEYLHHWVCYMETLLCLEEMEG